MSFAICINCGATKQGPIKKCANCSFTPKSNREKAKSIMMSTSFEIENDYRGKNIDELKTIADDLKRGIRPHFDENEIYNLIAYAETINAILMRKILIDGVKWIGPPVAILVVLYSVLLLD